MKKYLLAVALSTAAVTVSGTNGGLALGQATATGTIVGVVTDASGAAISNVSVSAIDKATNAQRVTKTNSVGEYRFDLLSAGTYVVHVEAAGFNTTDTQPLLLQVGASVTANLPLQAGSVTTIVDVAATNLLMDAEKTDSSTNVTPQEIQDLPLNGRDFAQLAILAPGVKLVNSYDPTKNRYAVYAVNGSTGRNNNTTVNGIDNKDNTVGGAVMQLPLEAVEEFKISSARFSAENGRSEGAALNVITKAGSNNFHGSLFGFFRNDAIQRTTRLLSMPASPSRLTAASSMAGAQADLSRKTARSASLRMRDCVSARASAWTATLSLS